MTAAPHRAGNQGMPVLRAGVELTRHARAATRSQPACSDHSASGYLLNEITCWIPLGRFV